ncbi:MAG: inner membrane CreD family protein, partial [Bacteroidota bacterium]
MNENRPPLDHFSRWVKHSVTLKLLTIGILVLILLIPSSMIRSIIREREKTRFETEKEVSDMWADRQTIAGPVVHVPLIYEMQKKVKIKDAEAYKIEKYDVKKVLTILPSQLKIGGEISPKKLRRGIYEIVVYNSKMEINGSFDLDVKFDETNLKKVIWEDAFVTIGISDLRGIQ